MKANKGALLDLKNSESQSTKGLMLPRVSLIALDALTMGENVISDTDSEWVKHVGLLVYNVNRIETKENRICPGGTYLDR